MKSPAGTVIQKRSWASQKIDWKPFRPAPVIDIFTAHVASHHEAGAQTKEIVPAGDDMAPTIIWTAKRR
jgi:hypothetical protein